MSAEGKPKFPREKALVIAQEIYERLAPFCLKCKVAGSLRRYRSHVGDIEMLFIPKMLSVPTLLPEDHDSVDQADVAINLWIKQGLFSQRLNSDGRKTWGRLNKLAVHIASGIPVDFFSTTLENWWVSLVIRTGGKRTNLALTMGANKRGLTLNAYGSGFTNRTTGEKIPCNSEQDVFKLAGIPYIDPQYRA